MMHVTALGDAGSPNWLQSSAIQTKGSRRASTLLRRCLFISLMTALVLPSRIDALTINATFDVTITSDPNAAAIEATINSAIAVYEADFSDPITVAFTFYKTTNGLASSSSYILPVSYADYLAALKNHATSADDGTALAHLPSSPNNPVNGNTSITLKTPLARALGFSASPPPGKPDSSISLNISIMNITSSNPNPNYYSLFSAVSHEMDEGLAFGGGLDGKANGQAAPTDDSVEPQDLCRYDQNGARSWTTALNALAYCSFDGVTDLVQFNQNAAGDFEDWYSTPSPLPRVQDAFGTPGASPVLGVELRVLDAIGFTYKSSYQTAPVWVDFNYSGSQNGSYQEPYEKLASGVSAVANGGTIAINAAIQSSTSSETMTISKPMTIISVAGPSTIGP